MEKIRFHVFLSHSSADKPAVEALAHWLRRESLEPWLDKWNLIPGEPWQQEIEQALRACATCAVCIGPSGIGPWQNEEMRTAIDRRVSQGNFRVIPVLLPGGQREERSHLPTFLTTTTWVEFRRTLDEETALHRLKSGILGVPPGPGPDSALWTDTCPYRGLNAFESEHAAFFLGREALTEWLLEALRSSPDGNRENRFLAIVGASGSGKSSLARAGLLPAFSQGALPGSAQWPVVICKPGPDPLESLAIAVTANPVLGTGLDVGELMERLHTDPRRLHLTIRQALYGQPATQRAVVLVDQFEEIFTLCQDDRLRQAFIDNLLHAANTTPGQTLVLLTLRADFYGRCAAFPKLAAALSDHQFLIGPLATEELRTAIVRPAQLVGCEFEPGLVEMLLQEVQHRAGALPILQYALLQLWERREGRRLTVSGYQAIGKLTGALEQRANTLYAALSDIEKAACRRIFLRLTQPGEGTEDTKRRASLSELGGTPAADSVLKKLVEARLITVQGASTRTAAANPPSAESFVEVSHEALIQGWSKLREWLDADRDALRIQHRLAQAAREWDSEGRANPEAYVYRGVRLAEAEAWAQTPGIVPSALEQEFLETSIAYRNKEQREEEERRRKEELSRGRELEMAWELAQTERRAARRLRRRNWLIGIVAVIALLFAMLTTKWWFEAEEALQAARQQSTLQ